MTWSSYIHVKYATAATTGWIYCNITTKYKHNEYHCNKSIIPQWYLWGMAGIQFPSRADGWPGRGRDFSLCAMSRLALSSTRFLSNGYLQHFIRGYGRWRMKLTTPLSGAKVKNMWNYTPIPSYVFMVCVPLPSCIWSKTMSCITTYHMRNSLSCWWWQ